MRCGTIKGEAARDESAREASQLRLCSCCSVCQPARRLHFTNRWGLLTFNSSGQLVCYPIFNLDSFKKNLRWYVASLENTLIETCKRFDVQAATTCDSGVWVKDNKIAAVGE